MSNQIDHLVKMANEIVLNQSSVAIPEETSINNAASHISRFWTPAMKQAIKEYMANDGADLDHLTQKVVAKLS